MPDSEKAFRRLADSFPGFCWIVSLAPEQPRLVYASPAVEPFWKWCRQKIEDDITKLPEIVYPEDVSRMKQAWNRLLQGEKVSGECRLMGSTGEVNRLTVQAGPLDPENSPPRLIAGFCLDYATCLFRCQAEAALAWEAQVNAALAELSRAVIDSAPPDDLSRLVLAKARELTGSEGGSVAYFDWQSRELVFPDLAEESKESGFICWHQERLDWSARWARCLAESQPLLINDPPDPAGENAPSPSYHRFLCVPAVFRDRLLGQIALATSLRDFEARDLEALERLASLFAMALERQQAEEALREKEERFRSLVEAISDLVWETDAAGRLTFIGPNVQDLLGYTPAEVLGKTFLELLDADEAERMGDLLSPILEAQKPYVFVGKTIRHKCGKRVFLESSGVPIVDSRGAFLGYRGIDRNITERHRAAETLYREKEKYRTLVEESPLGLAIIGEKGDYKYINPMFVRIFGYSLDDIPTGRDWFSCAFPDPAYRQGVIANWFEDLGKSHVGESRLRTYIVTCKNGSQKIINFRPVTLITGDQLVIYEDVTEHQRAEAALRESEAKYRLLVSNIPAVVFRGYADWSVEFFDDKVAELTGYPKEDFNSGLLKWSDLILPEDLDENQRIFCQALKTTGGYVRQYRIRHKQGHVLWIQARGQIIQDPNSRIDHVYGVFFDITKQRKIEEALRESEEHLKTIMDSIRAGVVMINSDNLRIVDINRYAADMLGMAKDRIIGEECKKLICFEHSGICPAITQGRVPEQTECRLVTAQGPDIPILKSAATLKRQGQSYILESFLDLTAQKKVEQDLAAEKERLLVTLRSIGEGVIATDTTGKVVLMNQVAEALTGWTQEEALGRPVAKVLSLIHEITRKSCDNRVDKVIRTGKVVRLSAHTMLLAKDGAERVLAASAAPIIDQAGQVIGVVLVFQDITVKRQTEAELQKMEKLTSLGIPGRGHRPRFQQHPHGYFRQYFFGHAHHFPAGAGFPASGGGRAGHPQGPGPGAATAHLRQGRGPRQRGGLSGGDNPGVRHLYLSRLPGALRFCLAEGFVARGSGPRAGQPGHPESGHQRHPGHAHRRRRHHHC
jgi:PAS domain S-box-containing protein